MTPPPPPFPWVCTRLKLVESATEDTEYSLSGVGFCRCVVSSSGLV